MIWGPYIGHVGTIKAMMNMAISMARYGNHEVYLIRAHSEFDGYDEYLHESGVGVIDLGLSKLFPGLQNSERLARRPYMWVSAGFGFPRLVSLFNKEKPDLLITNLLAVPAILAASCAHSRPKIIASIQGYPRFLGIKGKNLARWKLAEEGIRKYLWSRVYPRADAIVCLTSETKEKLERLSFFHATSFYVLPNPIVSDDVYAGARKNGHDIWFDSTAHPKLTAVGRLSHQKDFSTLIDAMCLVKKRYPDVKLGILGEGELRSELQEKINFLKLNENIRLLGFRDNPFSLVSRSDVFVLSSLWEDPGHAIIEAAALGKKIVTTDCPSGPEALVEYGAGGWVCETGNAEEMAKSIIDALEYRGVEKQKIAMRNAQKYTMQAFYQEISCVLDDLNVLG